MDTMKEYKIISSSFWLKFSPTQTNVNIIIDRPNSNPIANINKVILFEGICTNLIPLDTINLNNYDSVIYAKNLNVSNLYYLKVMVPILSTSNPYGKFKIGVFNYFITGGSKAPCCPGICNYIPNPDLSDYTGTLNINISNYYSCLTTNNVCGWTACEHTPQLKNVNDPEIYMCANNSWREAVYTQLNNGNTLPHGTYFLRLWFRDEANLEISNFVVRQMSSVPTSGNYTSGTVLVNQAVTSTAYNQLIATVTITAAN